LPGPTGTLTVAILADGEETSKVTHAGPATMMPPTKPVKRRPQTGNAARQALLYLQLIMAVPARSARRERLLPFLVGWVLVVVAFVAWAVMEVTNDLSGPLGLRRPLLEANWIAFAVLLLFWLPADSHRHCEPSGGGLEGAAVPRPARWSASAWIRADRVGCSRPPSPSMMRPPKRGLGWPVETPLRHHEPLKQALA
jgi:hypothetical protein